MRLAVYLSLIHFIVWISPIGATTICLEEAGGSVNNFIKAMDTIFPKLTETGLHYLFKDYSLKSSKCGKGEVLVTGPLFTEDGVDSNGHTTTKKGETYLEAGASFCMSLVRFESERKLGRSVFQTRLSSGTLNEGTSFLVGDNIIMTNHHVAAPGADGKDCRSLQIALNKEPKEWIGCKKVLFCDEAQDVCFVEMKPPSPNKQLGDLVPKLKLNCSSVAAQNASLIGNTYGLGVQASEGPVQSMNAGTFKHWIPMTGGASGSPIFNEKEEVIGINFGHATYGDKGFVSMDGRDYNMATSMSWIKEKIPKEIGRTQFTLQLAPYLSKESQNRMKEDIEDLKKIEKLLKINCP